MLPSGRAHELPTVYLNMLDFYKNFESTSGKQNLGSISKRHLNDKKEDISFHEITTLQDHSDAARQIGVSLCY